MTKTVMMTPSQLALAKKFGLTPTQYAEHLAKHMNAHVDDEYEENPNKIEIMNVPIKTLRDLWAFKFDTTWVDINDLDEEWDRICGRLDKYGVFEEHSGGDWVKLKDEL